MTERIIVILLTSLVLYAILVWLLVGSDMDVSEKGALIEELTVRVRYGSPINHVWTPLTFVSRTTLPDLGLSTSYDPKRDIEFIALEKSEFELAQTSPGPASVSFGLGSSLLYSKRCMSISAHSVFLSKHACPQTDRCVACDPSSPFLCSFVDTAFGHIHVLSDTNTLSSSLEKSMRFGETATIGPLVVRTDNKWVKLADSSMNNTMLNLEALGNEQVMHFDLTSNTLCAEKREIRPHKHFGASVVDFALVVGIAAASNPSQIVSKAASALSTAVALYTLSFSFTPRHIDLRLSSAVYFVVFASIIVGALALFANSLFTNRSVTWFTRNGLWAALFAQQYFADAGTWQTLPAVIVLGAWLWVTVADNTWPSRFFMPLLVFFFTWLLTLRNFLLITTPLLPSILVTITIIAGASGTLSPLLNIT